MVMTDIQALRRSEAPAIATVARSSGMSQRAAQDIIVEMAGASRLAQLRSAWSDLLPRADAPNVFMDPAVVQVAAEIEPNAHHRALLAWQQIDGQPRLAGIWALSIGRVKKSALPMRVVTVPPHLHCNLATPVIDRDCLDEVLDAMLDSIAADPELPNIVALDGMATDGLTFAALTRVLAARGSAPCIFEQFNRPKLQSRLDGKTYLEQALSSSTRKKLRQQRRRLSEKGALTTRIVSRPDDVATALGDFLAIEAAGWKGRQGTALLCNDNHVALVRGTVASLAAASCVSIHSLYLGDAPVSMQIILRAGPVAFTWKTTYDERFRDYSPGMLLFEDYTTAFLADPSIALVDSCSLDDSSYMSAWIERQAVADLWIDARRNGSLEFRILSALQRNYRDLRAATKSAYLALRKSRKR